MSVNSMDSISRQESFLVVVDLQIKLIPAILEIKRILDRASALTTVAHKLDVPVLITEHCASKIGKTDPIILESAPRAQFFSKTHFGAIGEPNFLFAVQEYSSKTAIVCGTEAHVCVYQTALGLLRNGFRTVVVSDAVGSRKAHDYDIALSRMRSAGIEIASTEMIIFEWLSDADDPNFLEILPIVKGLKPNGR